MAADAQESAAFDAMAPPRERSPSQLALAGPPGGVAEPPPFESQFSAARLHEMHQKPFEERLQTIRSMEAEVLADQKSAPPPPNVGTFASINAANIASSGMMHGATGLAPQSPMGGKGLNLSKDLGVRVERVFAFSNSPPRRGVSRNSTSYEMAEAKTSPSTSSAPGMRTAGRPARPEPGEDADAYFSHGGRVLAPEVAADAAGASSVLISRSRVTNNVNPGGEHIRGRAKGAFGEAMSAPSSPVLRSCFDAGSQPSGTPRSQDFRNELGRKKFSTREEALAMLAGRAGDHPKEVHGMHPEDRRALELVSGDWTKGINIQGAAAALAPSSVERNFLQRKIRGVPFSQDPGIGRLNARMNPFVFQYEKSEHASARSTSAPPARSTRRNPVTHEGDGYSEERHVRGRCRVSAEGNSGMREIMRHTDGHRMHEVAQVRYNTDKHFAHLCDSTRNEVVFQANAASKTRCSHRRSSGVATGMRLE